MNLTRDKILEALLNVLQESQEVIVDEPEQINEDTKPIGDLSLFDSLASVEATVNVLVALGFEIDDFPSHPSIFISKQRKALTVGQIADVILGLKTGHK